MLFHHLLGLLPTTNLYRPHGNLEDMSQFVLMFGSTLSIQDLQTRRGARDASSECLAGMIAPVPDGRLQQRHRNVNFNGSHRCLLYRLRWSGARSVLQHHRVPSQLGFAGQGFLRFFPLRQYSRALCSFSFWKPFSVQNLS